MKSLLFIFYIYIFFSFFSLHRHQNNRRFPLFRNSYHFKVCIENNKHNYFLSANFKNRKLNWIEFPMKQGEINKNENKIEGNNSLAEIEFTGAKQVTLSLFMFFFQPSQLFPSYPNQERNYWRMREQKTHEQNALQAEKAEKNENLFLWKSQSSASSSKKSGSTTSSKENRDVKNFLESLKTNSVHFGPSTQIKPPVVGFDILYFPKIFTKRRSRFTVKFRFILRSV